MPTRVRALVHLYDPADMEPKILLVRTRVWRRIKSALRHPIAFLIQAEYIWDGPFWFQVRRAGNHMAWMIGNEIIHAVEGGVKRQNAAILSTWDDVTIYAFAFHPALSRVETPHLAAWLADQEGKPYDYVGFGIRAINAIGRLLWRIGILTWRPWRVPDALKAAAFYCYKLIAYGAEAIKRNLNDDPDTFGPPALWKAVDEGKLKYLGVVKFKEPS